MPLKDPIARRAYQAARLELPRAAAAAKHVPVEDLPGEIWKPISDYEGVYSVSNMARVKSHDRYVGCNSSTRLARGKILTMSVNNKGYQAGVLVDGTDLRFTTTLHRLVAKAFVPGYAPGLTVNHIDGVKIHNLPANLEWCSIQDNLQHAFETGLRKWVSPELRAEMLALSAAGMPNAHIAKQVGTSASTADNVCGSAHIKWVTKEQKEAVRLERWALGTTYKKLAEKHRISKTHVCRICKGLQVNEMVSA